MITIIGIDPGKSGGIAFLFEKGTEVYPMPETERDVYDLLEGSPDEQRIVFLEKVHAMPKNGATSMFTFGMGYGFLRGIITALKYPLHDVIPQRWQKEIGCMSRGDKNVTKQKAQQLFPQLKVNHSTADALLIAEYGRRTLIIGHPQETKKKAKFNR